MKITAFFVRFCYSPIFDSPNAANVVVISICGISLDEKT